MKAIKKEKLMQCKVRVKGMIDVLLSACRTSKVSTGGGSKGIPHKLCEFFAKYFVHDGVAFPNNYLWKTEERELEFNSVGMTRRMVYSEDLDAAASKKKDDEDEAQFDPNVLLNTDRPRLLIVNFLIARVLIGQVLLNTESCQGLGGSSNNSSNNSNNSTNSQFNYKSKRNLQYIASMFYLILQKLYEELPEAYGKPIDKKKIVVDDDDDEDQDLKEAKLQLSKLKMHTMSSLRHADGAKKKKKKKKKEGDEDEDEEDEEDEEEEEEGKGKGKGKKGKKGKRKGETRDSLRKKKKAAAEAKKQKAVALANEKKTKKAAATLAKKKAAEKKKKAAKAALAKKRGTELRKNPDIFTVVFENGPLGLDLEAYRNGKGASIVGIKENTQSAKKRKLYEGQHIVKIGRRKVDTIPFSVILGKGWIVLFAGGACVVCQDSRD
jgi:preprotein translocase subunit SecG